MNGYLKLGDLLVSEGLITNLQLSAVLTAQKTSKRRLGDLLVERGLVTEGQIAESLAKQYGYELAELEAITPSADALALMDPEIAMSYCVLPVEADAATMQCVIADPLDIVGTDFISQMVRRRLDIKIAAKSDLLKAISAAYSGAQTEPGQQACEGVAFPPARYADVKARKRIGRIALFDALDTELGRKVTLASTREGSEEDQGLQERVKAIARTTAKAVCAVHDSFVHDQYRFTVFEMIEGEPLSQVMETRGPRTIMQAAEMVAELAEGIDALNRAGGSVGIINPDNVLVRWNGPLLLPFSDSSELYGAPEGSGSQATSDIYAMGTLMWEAITGDNPHSENWADPQKAKNLPTALKDILTNCLHADPRARYATAFQLSNALRSYNWGSVSLTVQEGGGAFVPTSRDREELLEIITIAESKAREPFWKRWFGKGRAA